MAFFTGDHAKDGWLARIGLWATRLVQKGPYADITHVEAIHAQHADGTVTIASASLRDGGVRSKRCTLTPGNWLMVDVPQWDVARSIALLDRTHGQPYDWRGALATVLPGKPQAGRWFCNPWVSWPFLGAAETFGPHHLAAIALSIGRDVTREFFSQHE